MRNKIEQHYQELDETTQNVINSTGLVTAKYNEALGILIVQTIKDPELKREIKGTSVYINALNTRLRFHEILEYKQDVCVSGMPCEFTRGEIDRKYFN